MFIISKNKVSNIINKNILTLGFWNFIVAVIALSVAVFTAWKQLRDVDDLTQVVYDVSTTNPMEPSLMHGALSLVIYNSGTQPVALNNAYLYFVEHKFPRGRNKFGQEIIEEHPLEICSTEVSTKFPIGLRIAPGPSGAAFQSIVIQKQEIKALRLYFDLDYTYDYLSGYYEADSKIRSLGEFEGAICLMSSYSSLSVEKSDLHERLFVGRFYNNISGEYYNKENKSKPYFLLGIPMKKYDHKKKVY